MGKLPGSDSSVTFLCSQLQSKQYSNAVVQRNTALTRANVEAFSPGNLLSEESGIFIPYDYQLAAKIK